MAIQGASRRRRAGSPPSRRAGSRGRAPPPRRCAPPAGRGATATAWSSSAETSASSVADRSSIRRRPRWTWPSRRPSSVWRNAGPAPELDRATDVVQQRGGEQEVVAQARMELGGLAAERRDADRVLEQAAGVAVVPVRPGGGERAERRPDARRRRGRPRRAPARPGCDDLAREEVEEAVELVGIAAHRGRQLGGIRVGRGLDGAHLHLEPAAEALHAPEHADGVALGEAAVEQLDVVPDPRLDPPARVDELEREVRRAVLRPPSLLAPDGVDALDGAILGELGDAGHACSLGSPGGTLGPWPTWPRFARSATRSPTATVTAPPYDVLTPEAARRLPGARSAQRRPPHAERLRGRGGPAVPDVARRRRARARRRARRVGAEPGLRRPRRRRAPPRRGSSPRCASSRTRPGTVLPHERTHAGPKESRLRLLRAARAQLEPIFLLYDGEPAVTRARPRARSRRRGHAALARAG